MNHHHDEPPVPGYDGLSAGEIAHRIRSLPAAELAALLRYEQAHADRAPVVQLITARQAELAAGSTPSPGGQGPPDLHGPASGGSAVGPTPSAQPFSSPPHGTPYQPGKPKGDQRSS
jgi:hypothetical protein